MATYINSGITIQMVACAKREDIDENDLNNRRSYGYIDIPIYNIANDNANTRSNNRVIGSINLIPYSLDIMDVKKLLFYNCSDDFKVTNIKIYWDNKIIYRITPSDYMQFIDGIEETVEVRGQTCKIMHLDRLGLMLSFIRLLVAYCPLLVDVAIEGNCDICKLNCKVIALDISERRNIMNSIQGVHTVPATNLIKLASSEMSNDNTIHISGCEPGKINGVILAGFTDVSTIASVKINTDANTNAFDSDFGETLSDASLKTCVLPSHMSQTNSILVNLDRDQCNCNVIALNAHSIYIPFNDRSYSDAVCDSNCIHIRGPNDIISISICVSGKQNTADISTVRNDHIHTRMPQIPKTISMYAYYGNDILYQDGCIGNRFCWGHG